MVLGSCAHLGLHERLFLLVLLTVAHLHTFQANPEKYRDVAKSLVYILQQIISRTFPTEFEHNNIPAPWLQIQLLQCMAKLGENDPR
jgi:hypothetical protein